MMANKPINETTMMSYSLVEAAAERLHAQGLRMTAQRRLILQTLEQHVGQHLDAEALHQHARTQDQSISLATVYRTVNVLLEAGLIEQRFLGHDRSRAYYEIRHEEHFHLTCLDCGQVIEFETDLVDQIRTELEARYGLEIIHTSIHFQARCPRYPKCASCPPEDHSTA